MNNFKIKWVFLTSKTACSAIDALGAKSLDNIKTYVNGKSSGDLFTRANMLTFKAADLASKRAIRYFFKKNKGMNDYLIFNRK